MLYLYVHLTLALCSKFKKKIFFFKDVVIQKTFYLVGPNERPTQSLVFTFPLGILPMTSFPLAISAPITTE